MNDFVKPFVLLLLFFLILAIGIPLIDMIPEWSDSGVVVSAHYGVTGGFLVVRTTQYFVIQTDHHGLLSGDDPCQRVLNGTRITVTKTLNTLEPSYAHSIEGC